MSLAATAGLLFGLPSCSFILDTSPNQCETNADCTAKFPGTTCSTTDHICVGPGVGKECSTNQECLSKDPNKICRKSDGTCQPVKTPECDVVVGDLDRDDALMIGSILPLSDVDESLGKPVDFAIRLAIGQLKTGIPTTQAGVLTPLLYIGCDDKSDATDKAAVAAAQHLSKTLEVPVIIGEAFSGSTLKIAGDVTIQAGTLLISPAATSDKITGLKDEGLVWRTSPPDVLQAAALKRYIPKVEDAVREDVAAAGGQKDDPIKLAVIHNEDTYGIGLADTLIDAEPFIQVNGSAAKDTKNKDYFIRRQYLSEDTASQETVITELAEKFHPHIIVMFGFTEAVGIMNAIEKQWTAGTLKPRYVFSDGAVGSDLSSTVANDSALRARITGTIPGTDNDIYKAFLSKYQLTYPGPAITYPASTFGAAGGYDSVFLIAYSSVASGVSKPSGKQLAEGMKKLSDPDPMAQINAGDTDFDKGIQALRGKGAINYNGASGPLDFNNETGEASSDIQIWCLPVGEGNLGTGSIINSGLFYKAESGDLSGTFTPCPNGS